MFNKGLDKNGKQEGLLRKIKNIENKTDEQLLAIKDSKDNKGSQLVKKSIGYDF